VRTRREFLAEAAAFAGAALTPPAAGRVRAAAIPSPRPRDDAWARAAAIRARVTVPVFPDREFPIVQFGAREGGVADCSDAFRRAIAACAAAGGGHVVVPPGRFLTGPIHLDDRVDLHLEREATVAFSQDPRHYLPLVFTRWEGVELMNYSPLIYAFGKRGVAITGEGTLDGQASEEHWWSWKGRRPDASPSGPPHQGPARARLMDLAARGVPVSARAFGEGGYLRPNFIQPYRCQDVLVEGVRIVNAPMWQIHPVLCSSVTVRGVTVVSHGPNNDGCDPESCRDVVIEGCTFDTGDDCIALKSGRNDDGRRVNVPVENVVIRDCVMRDGHGGVVIGSEISGGAREIFAESCRMDSPNLDRALRIKTNSVRGGVVEHVYMRDVVVGEVAEAVVTVNFFYEEGDAGTFPPVVRDIEVRNVRSRKSQHALLLRGYAHAPITDVRIRDCDFDGVAKPDVVEGVRGLVFENVRVNGIRR
jgi:polygalacturonase